MNGNLNKHKQQGIALILSLLLLFVLVILGVAGFSNTHIQERSAGNARLQTQAFEAASAGANNAINFFDSHRDIGMDQDCGATDHIGWVIPKDPDDPDDKDVPVPSAWVDMGTVGSGDQTATLRQRMYCLADVYPCSEEEEDAGVCTSEDRPPRSQLFVQSRGEVTIDGDVVAQRDVEVRLEVGSPGGGPGDGCSAICFPGCNLNTVVMPTSGSFTADAGDGNPSIATSCTADKDKLMAAIEDRPNGTYSGDPPVAVTNPGSPWDNVNDVKAFSANLRESAIAAQAVPGSCPTGCYFDTSINPKGKTAYGTLDKPQITYVNGNADFDGNVTGAGILVVNGNLTWTGTPAFKGLILVLGGTFNSIGSGKGGSTGSIVVLNATGDDFGAVNADFTGGGNGSYTYDCKVLQTMHGLLLNETGQTMWSPECVIGPENIYQAGPEQMIIASWRENIGWREIAD